MGPQPFLPFEQELFYPKPKPGEAALSLSHLAQTRAHDFACILVDIPWAFRNRTPTRGAAAHHYSVMQIDEVLLLPVASLAAPGCHLHLWIPAALLFDYGQLVLDAWGFRYRSHAVWVKTGAIGLGATWRCSHELLLFATKPPHAGFQDRGLSSWFEAPRERHSKKPDLVYDLLERASPGPRLELFARALRPGWTSWGLEVGSLLPSARQRAQ